MADKKIIYGSVEYYDAEIECTTPGVTFTYTEWTGKIAVSLVGAAFDAATATWEDATLLQVDSKDYARILVGSDITPTVGEWNVYVKLTKTSGGTEIPAMKAGGKLIVTSG